MSSDYRRLTMSRGVAALLAIAATGWIALWLAWHGAARQLFVGQQVPYLVSGSVLGTGLVATGSVLAAIQDRREERARERQAWVTLGHDIRSLARALAALDTTDHGPRP